MFRIANKSKWYNKKDIQIIIGIPLFSILLCYLGNLFKERLYFVLSPDTFLTVHIFLEFSSIAMSFAIFAITYYTFEVSKRLSMMIIAYTFFIVALLDMFHTLSYKGMPVFLTESSVEKATIFWIMARLVMSIGVLSANLIFGKAPLKKRRSTDLIFVTLFTVLLIILVSYYPDIFPDLFIEREGLTSTKLALEYIIIFIQVIAVGVCIRLYRKYDESTEFLLTIAAFLFSIHSELAFTMYNDVYDIYNLLGHIYKIVAYYIFFRALFVINVHKPYRELNEAEKKLSSYVENLEKAVKARTAEIESANRKLLKNLDDAKQIQMALMTTDFPKIPGMEFAAKYLPCEKVGGDFYNIFRLDDENVGILIGDVAGHGVSAAMVNVFINQNLRFKIDYEDGRHRIFTPRGVLMHLYHLYNSMSFPEEMYVVLFYGIYNLNTRDFFYASAGMNTLPLIIKRTGEVVPLKLDGFPICRFGDYFKPSYETKNVVLDPGDTLVFYSDGLGEIDRQQPGIFNTESIIQYLSGIQNLSAQSICNELAEAYQTLLDGREMLDDVTILVVKTPLSK